MGQIIKYELKKIIKRPFTLVVIFGCLAVFLFIYIYGPLQEFRWIWGPDEYGSYENIPEKELKRAHENYGFTGEYDGVIALNGLRAIAQDQKNSAHFAGEWNDEKLKEIATEYLEFINNPDIYDYNKVDSWATTARQWTLQAQGMSTAEVEEYNAKNPIYEMKTEYHYGERMRWGSMANFLENYVIEPGGRIRSFDEVFPNVNQPAKYEYYQGASISAQYQAAIVGIISLLILIAGLAPMFSDEVSQKTEPMLLAARHGRNKLIKAKICAGFIFSLCALVAFTILNVLLMGAFYGFSGFGVPLQFGLDTYTVEFSLTFGQMLLAFFLVQILGLLAMAGLLMLLSSLLSSAIPVVFGGSIFAFATIILSITNAGRLSAIAQTLPAALGMPYGLMYTGKAKGWDFLGIPQWVLAIIVCSVLLIASVIFIVNKYKRPRTT